MAELNTRLAGQLQSSMPMTSVLASILSEISRSAPGHFDVDAVVRATLEVVVEVSGARGAYLRRRGGSQSGDVIAYSEAGAAVALDDSMVSVPLPVIFAGRAVGTLVLMREAGSRELVAAEMEQLALCSDLIAAALGREDMDLRITESEDALKSSTRKKAEMLGGISMSLKNTLSTAAGYVQLIDMSDQLSAQQHEYTSKARRSVHNAVILINEMVELARTEAGDVQVEMSSVNLNSYARDAAKTHQHEADEKRILLTVETLDDRATTITDSSHVSRIVDALVANAIRYTPEGGFVAIRVDRRDGRRYGDPLQWVCVSVQDSGPGLGDGDNIFEEVRRVEHPAGRLGFRLAICRRLARLLGGDLTVESEAGSGANFTFWLPAN